MSIRFPRHGLAVVFVSILVLVLSAGPAGAQDLPPALEEQLIESGELTSEPSPVPAVDPIPDLTVTVGDDDGGSSQPLTIVLVLTVLALAPTMLIMLTAFTRTIIVLGITRNALSLQGIPPNQVLVGLSLFLTIFVMSPVLAEANEEALQPLLNDEITQAEAFDRGVDPFKKFMLKQVRESRDDTYEREQIFYSDFR